jgi:hypothetical protein
VRAGRTVQSDARIRPGRQVASGGVRCGRVGVRAGDARDRRTVGPGRGANDGTSAVPPVCRSRGSAGCCWHPSFATWVTVFSSLNARQDCCHDAVDVKQDLLIVEA